MRQFVHRRDFLRGLAASGVALTLGPKAKAGPNEKLNIGIIGTSGRALGNIEGVEGENIVAVCDIDDRLARRGVGTSSRGPRPSTTSAS